MKRMIGVIALFLLLLLAGGCSSETASASTAAQSGVQTAERIDPDAPSASRSIFAMDTYMTVTCYGDRCEEAADAAVAEIQRLDVLLSVGNEESEIARINASGEGSVSSDTAEMLEESLMLYRTTSGAFDITVYPLMELWGFTTGDFCVPEESELYDVLSDVGSDRLSYDAASGTLTLGEGQGIDLGGIAKGYTSDRLMELFAEYDLVSGVVSLGGNVECYGTKPDGSLWRCGIQDPMDPNNSSALLGVVEVSDCAVITSGAYERNFTDDQGRLWHHIIDPTTGYSADSGLISVSIVTPHGMLADGLSTACYILGLDGAIDYWRESDEKFEMILMTENGQLYVTDGLKDCFTGNYPVQMIEK